MDRYWFLDYIFIPDKSKTCTFFCPVRIKLGNLTLVILSEYGRRNIGDAEAEIETSKGREGALVLMEMQKVNSGGFWQLRMYCIPAAVPAESNRDYCHQLNCQSKRKK